MNRLPGNEMGPSRGEASVFGCLGLAGVAAILFATASATRFVDGRDAVIAVLEGRPVLVAPATINAGLVSPTNVTRIESKPSLARGRDKV